MNAELLRNFDAEIRKNNFFLKLRQIATQNTYIQGNKRTIAFLTYPILFRDHNR